MMTDSNRSPPEVATAGFKAIFEALSSDTPPAQIGIKPAKPEPPEDNLFKRIRLLSADEIERINRASPD